MEDLYYGLCERFVGRVVVEDPAAFAAWRGRPLLYLGNHQTGVESLLFSILASGLGGLPTVTLAKAEHRGTWLGRLIQHCFTWPGVRDPRVITYFDRQDKASLPAIIQELGAEMAAGARSVMVHVEGTRALECRTPVQKMSGAFLDMALAVGAAVVPVRFVGGLPPEPLERRLEYPFGFGTQDIWLGRPIPPAELRALPYGPRKDAVIAAINALGPPSAAERPNPGDPTFAEAVAALQERLGVDEEHAALLAVLRERRDLVPALQGLVDALQSGQYTPPPDAGGPWLTELARRLFGPRGPVVAER